MSKGVIVQVRFSEAEKRLIDKAAAKEGLNISDYVRMVVFTDMSMFGPREIWKATIENISYKVARKIEERFFKCENIDANQLVKDMRS